MLVSPGTYAGSIAIASAAGTAAKPINVLPFDVTQSPVIGTVDLQKVSYLRISGMTVSSPAWAGFIVRNDTHHTTISNNTIRNAPTGVNITTGAGAGNKIMSNLITGSQTHGVTVDVNSLASDRTIISYNLVDSSAYHGMEIHGSNYQIEYNTVTGSGTSIGGTSGIHLYATSESDDAGDNNLVRYNATYNNYDKTAHDGNGIQADQWCDNNTIAYNISWSNDGAGIQVYDARNNLVQGNTLYGNVRDPGGTHVSNAELMVAVSGLNRSASNTVRNNIVISTKSGVPAFYFNGSGVANGNVVGPNLYYNTAGGLVMRWGDNSWQQTASAIDAATGTAGNLVSLPVFANTGSPLTSGLALASWPGGSGTFLNGEVDMAGQAAVSGWSFFGAYFTKP